MRKRVVFVVAASAAAWAACSFPDVAFTPDGGEATEAGSDGPATSDAEAADAVADTTAPPQHDVDPEGGAHDAATRDTDAAVDRDAGADGGCGELDGSFCDCDSDDSLKEAGACVAPTAPDCDDFDPLVHPGEDFVAASWDPTSPHLPANDWDCDGTVIKQYNYGIGCSLFDCTEGFATDIPCGTAGTYNYCKASISILGISVCSVGRTETRTQGCR